jgi:hypothetical protein
MAQQIINVGTSANDGTGDTLRASQQKTNANTTELYLTKLESVVAGTNITIDNTDPLNPVVNSSGGGSEPLTLIREKFTFTSSQSFTLTNTPSNVVFVAVNGQVLDTSQYSLSTNVLTITDTLDANDNIIVVYNFSVGVGVGGGVSSVNAMFGDVVLTKSDISLSNVDNTSDLNKPISTATQDALNSKQDTLLSATNIKTINGSSILGSGNLVVIGGITRTIINISTTTTGAAAPSTDYVYIATSSFTYTQPTAVGNTNMYTIKNAGIGIITIIFTSGQNADGSTSITLNSGVSLNLISDNSNWIIT